MSTVSLSNLGTPAEPFLYEPVAPSPIATFVAAGAVAIGDRQITVSTSKSAGKIKPTLRLKVPTVSSETVGGAVVSAVIRTAYAEVKFTFDPTHTLDERNQVLQHVRDVLDNATNMIPMLRDGASAY
jgi:hypothetical protein